MPSNIPVYHNGERVGSLRARPRQSGVFEAFVNVNGQREALGLFVGLPNAQSVVRSAFEAYNQD